MKDILIATRIALVLDSSAWGGIEQHVSSLAKALKQVKNVSVHLILWQDYSNESLRRRFVKESQLDVHFCNGHYSEFLKLLTKLRVGCVHTHGYKMNLVGRFLKITTSIRVISTHHNGDLGKGKVRLYTWLDQLTAGLVENWAVSDSIKKRLRPTRATLVKNFVQLPQSQEHDDSNRILFVGRMQSVKRPERMLALAVSLPDMEFHLFGEGPLLNVLRASSPSNVTWHGYESNPKTVWYRGDICIICSDDEGLPLTALEAMGRGIPVVATPVGQLPNLISHGQNGWLADSVESMANILTCWKAQTESEKKAIRQNARSTIEEGYSLQSCLVDYLDLYCQKKSTAKTEEI